MVKIAFKAGILSLLVILLSKPVVAGDNLLNVQGKLTNSSFVALTGTYTVTFRLYANITDTVGSALWSESKSVFVSTGLFNVTLGTSTSMNSIAFNKPYYLGMQVAGDANELSPRQLLGASSYALGSLRDFSVGNNLVVSSSITAPSVIVSTLSAVSSATINTASVMNLTATSLSGMTMSVSTITAVSSATVTNLTVKGLLTYGGALGNLVKTVTATATTTFSTTLTSFSNTNLSASITPASASNKVIVLACGSLYTSDAATSAYATLARGTTNLMGANGGARFFSNGAGTLLVPACLIYEDSPATTSSTTYRVQLRSSNSGTVVLFGENDTLTQVMILIEVAS